MSQVVRALYNGFFEITQAADQRVADYPFLNLPSVLIITSFYWMFVTNFGPKLMKNRQPIEPKNLIKIYNLAQVVLNGWLFLEVAKVVKNLNLFCAPIYRDDEHLIEVDINYYYFLLKILDLLDTIFFVIRKKQSHVSFLHLYHHTGMVYVAYALTKWYGGGHTLYILFLNTFVHFVMYSYYFITTIDAKHKDNIWWKKHITQLQILQQIIGSISFTRVLFDSNCTYPKFPSYVLVPNGIVLGCLFIKFYTDAYGSRKSKTK